MKSDPNYPRMMFHYSKDPVIVYSEEQEAALGPGWSRKLVFASLPEEEKQPKPPVFEEEEPETEEPEEHPAESIPAPPGKPKRERPSAPKPIHKTAAHKRK